MQPHPLNQIAIVTSGRLSSLRRCLISYARHCDAVGRKCSFIVFDDTETYEDRKQCREWLIGFSRKYGVDVSYSDPTRKRRFARQLQAEGIPWTILDFALGGSRAIHPSPGRNRNAMLIHLVDELFFCSDDDAFCRPSDFRYGDQSVNVLKQGALSLDAYFFSSRKDAFAASQEGDCDVLAMHEALLGQSIEQLRWAPSEWTYFRRVLGRVPVAGSGNEGTETVSVTVSGVVGDSGIPDYFGFLLKSGSVRDRFLEAMRGQSEAFISRNIVRGVNRPSVAPKGYVFTTTGTGFDTRVLLPPFIPSGCGEDSLFGYLLTLCDPRSFSAHVPVGLAHDPDTARFYNDLPPAPTLVQILVILFGTCQGLIEVSTEERMRAVGRHLQEIAQADVMSFGQSIKDISRQIMQGWIELYMRRLTPQELGTAVLAEPIQRWVTQLRKSIRSDTIAVYEDFDVIPDSNESLRIIQECFLNYGLLLQAWPDIIAAARELRQRDYRIASRLRCTL